MSNASTESVKPPDLVQNADLLREIEDNVSGRTTPSSFRESPIGWGMSLLCGGVGYEAIEPREALVNYYNDATVHKQQDILKALGSKDKEAKLGLFAETMFYACARNFLSNHGLRSRSQSALTIYDTVETFNRSNTMNDQHKRYKLSSVAEMLTGRNSQLVADNVLSVCGALGMPYEAMLALVNRPDLVYKGFQSTFGEPIANVNGTNRGYALWVMYAVARQCYSHATSYVVDDMFYVDVHSQNGLDQEMDQILNEIGVFAEMNPQVQGYKLTEIEQGVFNFMPDKQFVNEKFRFLANMANSQYWDNHPEELNAHLLQLAYVLNSCEEEYSAILGLLRMSSQFVPNTNCIVGSVPSSIQDLIASHDVAVIVHRNIDLDGLYPIKEHVMTLSHLLRRAHRHYARHYQEKDWYIKGKMLSSDQKAQARSKLFDLMLDEEGGGWKTESVLGWGE